MVKYVAFLRGINVGGNHLVRMDQLKQLFGSLGLMDVQTYIQSGNVIFESEEKGAAMLERQIESLLAKELGYKVAVFLRTIQEVGSISARSPFKPNEKEALHIVFLSEKPGKKIAGALMSLVNEADDYALKGREIYNLRRDREKSVFSNNLIEKTLDISATTRNITTINKLVGKYS